MQMKDYWPTAARAVKAYANRKFSGFFTEAEVEDMVAEVVTKMWRARESFDPNRGTEFGWVWTIAKNAVNDAAMAKHKRENIGGCWNDDVEILYDRVRQERDKRILLYLADGLDYEEIAEREGLTMRATYMAVFHLRRRLENDAA